MDTVTPSGEADNHFGNVSSMMNASESIGIQASVTDGQELNRMDRDQASAMDEPESDVTDGHGSSRMGGHQSNVTEEEESNMTERNSFRIYEILHPFQVNFELFNST